MDQMSNLSSKLPVPPITHSRTWTLNTTWLFLRFWYCTVFQIVKTLLGAILHLVPVNDRVFSWEQLKPKIQTEDSKLVCNESPHSNKWTSPKSHSQGIKLVPKTPGKILSRPAEGYTHSPHTNLPTLLNPALLSALKSNNTKARKNNF